ncbi:MAG: tetratricopeptide repeat protein [Phycisphaerales bacterium]
MSDLDRLLADALERPESERAAFLERACGGDDALRAQVESLLADHERAEQKRRESFYSGPTADMAPPVAELPPTAERPGDQIDRYKLLQRIGEGGFGVVYMAEQREPVKRKVALKIIKLGMDTKQVIARFEAERQALAMMDHPNIAKVLDAGATHSGRPYFVMELVSGIPITEYCDRENLTTRERLELFIKVCRAVQHAHQKGIIHRDLKPSNVLVTLHDGHPAPKVIDFGIAKATNSELTQRTLFTEFRQFIGTPEYMSPEQAEMSGLDVDTRSDIYSLGVLLYELLTGMPPFDPRTLRSAAINEVQRIIREYEPHKPSTRLSELGRPVTTPTRSESDGTKPGSADAPSSAQYIARRRRTDPATLARQLRGDLDWIVMRALEKDRTRRYDTANAFAEDIERHLRDEPVLAGPPTTRYRLGKLYRRHRRHFVAAGFVVGAVMLGLAGTTIGMLWALDTARELDLAQGELEKAFEEAEEQRDIATAVSEFLNEDLLASVAPTQGGRDVTVRQVLDEASSQIGWRFGDRAAIRATLHQTIGQSYLELGLFDEAESHFLSATALRQVLYGDTQPTIIAYGNLASLYLKWDRNDDAARIYDTWIDKSRAELGDTHVITLGMLINLAVLHIEKGEYAEAEAILSETFRIEEETLGPDHEQTIMALGGLANIAMATGRIEEALRLFEDILARQLRSLGPEHPGTFMTQNNIANALVDLGRMREATDRYEETLRDRERVLGKAHPDTLNTMINLAIAYRSQDRAAEAGPLIEEVREVGLSVLGERHAVYRAATSLLAAMRIDEGRFEDARALFADNLRISEEALGPAHINVVSERIRLIGILRRLELHAEADELSREHIRIIRAAALATDADPELLNAAAWELATFEMEGLRDPAASVEFATRACEATGRRNAYYLDTLAVATAATGDPARALEIQREALALVTDEDPNRGEMLEHLEQFERAVAEPDP